MQTSPKYITLTNLLDTYCISGTVWNAIYTLSHLLTMIIEIIILSEVSQTEKDKYHMISLICGI